MRFRPCIDIHNGRVKQIVGGSLTDRGDMARENFSSAYDADHYAKMYERDGLAGGHVILLNPASSPYYEKTKEQAFRALRAYPGGLQAGGGVTAETAEEYLDAGASHVIVTSYIFRDGAVRWENLEKLCKAVGKEHVVVDVSCRKRENDYVIVTDRWQKFTEVKLSHAVLESLAAYCGEFLVHGVDVEGKSSGIDETLASLLGNYEGIPITYAGGIASMEDVERFRGLTGGKIDFTIGSALDIFGGNLPYDTVKRIAG